MDVKEAVTTAKVYAAKLFGDDGAVDFALEEVDFDRTKAVWYVTVSFRRARNTLEKSAGELGLALERLGPRYLKVVKIDKETGEVLSVTNREAGLAA
jgi:hypothetical protein